MISVELTATIATGQECGPSYVELDMVTKKALSAFREGIQEPLAVLYSEQIRGPLIVYLRGRFDLNELAAEDTTQNAWVNVARLGPEGIKTQGSFRAVRSLFYTTATNLAIMDYRGLQRRGGPPEEFGQSTEISLNRHLGDRPQEADLEEEETIKQIFRIIPELTDGQQRVIQLRFFEGKSVAETCRILGKSESAVKCLLHRAVMTLKRRLGI